MPASRSRCSRPWPAKGINIQVISTSEIKVSVLVAAEYTELAVRALHTAYELDALSAFIARGLRRISATFHKVLSCGWRISR